MLRNVIFIVFLIFSCLERHLYCILKNSVSYASILFFLMCLSFIFGFGLREDSSFLYPQGITSFHNNSLKNSFFGKTLGILIETK